MSNQISPKSPKLNKFKIRTIRLGEEPAQFKVGFQYLFDDELFDCYSMPVKIDDGKLVLLQDPAPDYYLYGMSEHPLYDIVGKDLKTDETKTRLTNAIVEALTKFNLIECADNKLVKTDRQLTEWIDVNTY